MSSDVSVSPKKKNEKMDTSNIYSNMTFFFRFVNKRASFPFGIISLAHVPVSVTRIIQSLYYAPGGRYINSSSDSADRGRSIIRVT